MKIFLAVFGAVVLQKGCLAQNVPETPCPRFFQYFQNSGVVYGAMEFPNDRTGFYTLSVNMSVGTYLTDNQNIKLELKTIPEELSRGQPVRYIVYFPVQNVIPKPTRIEFNNRNYCTSPAEPLLPGRAVTNMWATTYIKITTSVRPAKPSTTNEVDSADGFNFFAVIGATSPNPSQTGTFFTLPTVPQNPFTLPTVPQNPFTLPTVPPNMFSNGGFGFNPVNPPTPTRPPPATEPNIFSNPVTSPILIKEPSFGECGISSATHLIVGGDPVNEGQYPWMVAIMYNTREDSNYNYRCTGTLVSDRHVITAGHCVQYHNAPAIPAEDLLLVFGKNNIKNWANGAVLRDVSGFKAHPDYKESKGDADIAVLILKKPVRFSANVSPVCLWDESVDLDLVVNEKGVVVGWGMDESGKTFATEAKKVSMPIVSQVSCLRSDPGFTGITSNRTFCAGEANGSGPCRGDSGAGFIMRRNGKWTLRGVVSVSLKNDDSCDFDKYFVFADAAKVKSWLRKVMT